MPTLPEAGVRLTLDIQEFNQRFKAVAADAAKLDALNPTVNVGVNDADLKTAIGMADELDTTVSTKVSVDDAELSAASDQLDAIATIGAIDLAINVAGSAMEFVEGLGRFSGLGGLIEVDNALAAIEGRTGRMIPDAEKLISDLYTNGWGESREEIANTIVEATNLKIAQEDLAGAVLSAFQVQSLTGGETNEILRTMDTMVKNDLAPDLQTAADLLTVGFQNGADRGQDLLDTFNEYGSTFGQLRISGEGALAIINSGLDAGIDNSDRIADSIRETGIRLSEIGTDPNMANAFKQLDSMSDIDLASSLDAFEAGTISGDEFFGGFFQALADANEKDPTKAKNLAAQLVGTIAEDFGVEAISQLSPVWDDTMGEFEGRAEEAGNTISDTLGTTIETFLRTIEQSAVDLLSSDALDLDQKIDDLKAKLQEGMAELASGGTLGDALEVTFGIEGVDTALANVERVFGQFVIAALEIVAALQDPLGINDNDKGTRAEIARLAGQQLPFDLKVANPDEVAGIVDQAAARGVTNLGGAFNTAMDELISEGNFGQAQGLLDAVVTNADVSPEAAKILSEKWNKLIDDAQAQLKNVDIGPQPAGVDPMPAEQGAGASPFLTGLDSFKTKVGEVDTASTTAAENIATNFFGVNTAAIEALSGVDTAMDTTAINAEGLDTRLAMALTGNTVTQSFMDVAAAADASFPGVIAWMDKTAAEAAAFDIKVSSHVQHLINILKDLQFLSAAVATGVQQAITLGGQLPGAGTTNNTTNNVTVNNNGGGPGFAAASSYTLAASLRPGGA